MPPRRAEKALLAAIGSLDLPAGSGLTESGGEPSRHVTQCRLFVDRILKGAKPGGVPMNRSLTDHRTVMQCTVRCGGVKLILFCGRLSSINLFTRPGKGGFYTP